MERTGNISPQDVDAQKILQEVIHLRMLFAKVRSGCAWPSRLLALERLSGISSRA